MGGAGRKVGGKEKEEGEGEGGEPHLWPPDRKIDE